MALRPISVVVCDDYFTEATETPHWFSGLYDGKIRIPVASLEEHPEDLRDQLDVVDQLLDLPTLLQSFKDLPHVEARLAYFQSYWMTRGLVEERGWRRLHALLRDLERDPRARFEQRFAFHFGETPQTDLERRYDEML